MTKTDAVAANSLGLHRNEARSLSSKFNHDFFDGSKVVAADREFGKKGRQLAAGTLCAVERVEGAAMTIANSRSRVRADSG
jgi:hypothetical protein